MDLRTLKTGVRPHSLKGSGLEALVHLKGDEARRIKEVVLGQAALDEPHHKAGCVDGRARVQGRHHLVGWGEGRGADRVGGGSMAWARGEGRREACGTA